MFAPCRLPSESLSRSAEISLTLTLSFEPPFVEISRVYKNVESYLSSMFASTELVTHVDGAGECHCVAMEISSEGIRVESKLRVIDFCADRHGRTVKGTVDNRNFAPEEDADGSARKRALRGAPIYILAPCTLYFSKRAAFLQPDDRNALLMLIPSCPTFELKTCSWQCCD